MKLVNKELDNIVKSSNQGILIYSRATGELLL